MAIVARPVIGHSRLGTLWAVPSATLGIVLIGLDLATFPILAVLMLVLAARSS